MSATPSAIVSRATPGFRSNRRGPAAPDVTGVQDQRHALERLRDLRTHEAVRVRDQADNVYSTVHVDCG